MTLSKLLAALQKVADSQDATKMEVAVEGWDDNVYDGDKISGIRFVGDYDFSNSETKTVLFIVTEQGR